MNLYLVFISLIINTHVPVLQQFLHLFVLRSNVIVGHFQLLILLFGNLQRLLLLAILDIKLLQHIRHLLQLIVKHLLSALIL